MPSKMPASDGRWLRRLVGVAACLAVVALVILGIPRLGARSPVAIVVLCVLAVLIMKVVEHRVRRWFDHWAARQRSGSTPPPPGRQ